MCDKSHGRKLGPQQDGEPDFVPCILLETVPEDGAARCATEKRLFRRSGRVQICALRYERRQVVVARVIRVEMCFQNVSPSVHVWVLGLIENGAATLL